VPLRIPLGIGLIVLLTNVRVEAILQALIVLGFKLYKIYKQQNVILLWIKDLDVYHKGVE